MNEETTQPQDRPNTGAVMDVRPPAKPPETAASTPPATATEALGSEAVEAQTSETPVVVETEQPVESTTSEGVTESLSDTSQSVQEAAEAPPQPADEPASEEPAQDQASPLLAAKPKNSQKHGVRWVFVFAALVVLALGGAAVATYMASNTTRTDNTRTTTQPGAGSPALQLEDTQSAIDEANDTVEETVKDQDATDFPETELSDDQLGL